ncbi:phosphoglycerate mutase 2 isoform X2 [Phacochoerus africanus]|uniref:phosphoglycerate mutase 2 isoform X2 n=1 Tax=Phacochoerus africanus TaxID=41426 RepID=UPI001FDA64B0|nr:phosphoglycerate mutase 2 isoform X2 [Phacochoerus africanus]
MNSRFQISPKSRAGAVRPWSTLWEPCDYWSCSSRCTWEHSQGSRPRGLAVVKRTKSRQYVELWFESGQRQSSTTCPWHCSEGGLHLQAGVQSLRLRTRSWEPPHWAGSSAGRSIRTSLTSARSGLLPTLPFSEMWHRGGRKWGAVDGAPQEGAAATWYLDPAWFLHSPGPSGPCSQHPKAEFLGLHPSTLSPSPNLSLPPGAPGLAPAVLKDQEEVAGVFLPLAQQRQGPWEQGRADGAGTPASGGVLPWRAPLFLRAPASRD